jgi:hypothetical protein
MGCVGSGSGKVLDRVEKLLECSEEEMEARLGLSTTSKDSVAAAESLQDLAAVSDMITVPPSSPH